ncbi:hypothetical protein [Achromobacter phage CF418P1]|nr:hypothetical protein [Achromobacter phage CF418P1]
MTGALILVPVAYVMARAIDFIAAVLRRTDPWSPTV